MDTTTADILNLVCDFTDAQTLSSLCRVSKNINQVLSQLNIIERLFIRRRGFRSMDEFRKSFNLAKNSDTRQTLRNICIQIRSPSVLTEDDGVFLSILRRLAEKTQSTIKGVALLRAGHWNAAPSYLASLPFACDDGFVPSSADKKWFYSAQKAHPHRILNIVEQLKEWDGCFA